MSLLEDALDVLYLVLDYFGVPPEMLVPVWDSRLCGQYRSVVRMIGSYLPLPPTPRVYFQIPLHTSRQCAYSTEYPAIPSFADVLRVLEDEGDTFAKTRHHLPAKTPVRPPAPQPEALQKISALERELVRLRAQIAAIVTAADVPRNAAGTPLASPMPAAALTSTPRCASPPPPLLPPPPPPPPSSHSSPSCGTELFRRRKCHRKDADKKRLRDVQSLPSMLDVLKDLNQVKLRSVERSPGGTPVQKRPSIGGGAIAKDPAALIAEALKRKFAQHRHNNSSDKENSLESSPFGSPDAPKMFRHAGRSRALLHLSSGPPKP
ncbi:mitochondrial fission regulator 2 [Hippocampus zosterae]|uniref:mitochondrial fission regulator 2 n=1 Tax=Hippocampus zosterae TaxID=109293 RepID=UPI00223D30C7|nr:mitochondrial fission regulator 2 [Hippocampus zosterae]